MSWRIALRLLLSLVLVLNGIGDAFARAGMPVAASAGHHLAAATEQTSGSACHGHDRQMQAATHTSHRTGHDTGKGCCSTGTHDCACLQHATMAVPDVTLPAPPYLRAAPVAAGPSMHLPPWLPQPIRPPILDRTA